MQTKKLALLSTMLVGLAGPAFEADAANDASHAASEQVEHQQADAATDGAKNAGTDAATKVQDTASDATQPADAGQDTAADATQPADASQDMASDAMQQDGSSEDGGGVLLIRSLSVGTSDQQHQGEVLAGMTAEEVIGMTVVGRDNEAVGEVTDLLIAEDGTVDRAIVDVGGFLGFGDKSVALDIASLSLAEGDGELVSDLDADTVEDMPEWQQDDEGWYSE